VTEEPKKTPVSVEDFKNAMLHVTEMLKRVTSAYILCAMPNNEGLGPLIEFRGDMDESLMMLSRAEAVLHHRSLEQMRPQLEDLGRRPDQVDRPEVS